MTGARGMLGTRVVRDSSAREWNTVALDRAELDVTDGERVLETVRDLRPDAVIHCAAYTDVERAEAEPDIAHEVNERGTANVATACAGTGALCVYVSTDYVFDGRTDAPYEPDSPTNPINAYGASKLAGERRVRGSDGPWLIVRTSLLYGTGGKNFIDQMHQLAQTREHLEVVGDLRSRATWCGTLSPVLLDLTAAGARGVFHAADRGSVSRFELVRGLVELADLDTSVEEVPSTRFPTAAARPPDSTLDTATTEALLGRRLPGWKEALARHLRESGADRSA